MAGMRWREEPAELSSQLPVVVEVLLLSRQASESYLAKLVSSLPVIIIIYN